MYKKILLNDKKIQNAINSELERQKKSIILIASENYASNDVMKATGSVLTNKYAEGYSSKRYYDGTEFIDVVENLAIDRAKKLFNVKHVNVQPHSGSTANAAAIAAAIKPGEKILGLSLSSGGHLTHGYKVSFSGRFYKSATYSVGKDGYIDYDEVMKVAKKEKPQLIICGFSAYSRVVDFVKFREIADEVGAILLADIAHIAGIIAAKMHPSPVDIADIITTTTHKTLRGARGGMIMTNNDELAKKINKWVFPGYQGGPLMHSIAGKAVAFYEALKPSFRVYIKQVLKNASSFAQAFITMDVPVITGGTDTHLFTINVKEVYKISGKLASKVLEYIGIITNKNTIPNDQESPVVTSGLRIGTAAMTSRGFKEPEFKELARIIDIALSNPKDQAILDQLQKEVKELIKKFPIKGSY